MVDLTRAWTLELKVIGRWFPRLGRKGTLTEGHSFSRQKGEILEL